MSVLVRDPRVLWRRSGPRRLLLPPGRDEPLVLDGVAAALWDLLAEPVDEDELVGALVTHYDAEAATITSELTAFLDELAAAGAVQRR